MLTKETKLRLVHAVTSEGVASEIENRLISSTPANPAASAAALAGLNAALDASITERLTVGLAGDDRGAAGREIAKKLTGMVGVLEAHANGTEVAAVAATATVPLPTPVVFTSVAAGAARNGTTFTLTVNAAAPNPTNTVLVTFAGPAGAITCTITPNDGTNNGGTPVDLPSAEFVELLNTGAVVGKNITLSDALSRRTLQTATGGDMLPGIPGSVTVTFAGGINAIDTDVAPAKTAMGSNPMSDSAFECLVHALTSRAAAEEFRAKYDAMIAAVQAIAP